jgi:hypothetical protein
VPVERVYFSSELAHREVQTGPPPEATGLPKTPENHSDYAPAGEEVESFYILASK